MALLFGILTPVSAQFEPDKHAPNQSGWLGACIFSAKNAYFFFALIVTVAFFLARLFFVTETIFLFFTETVILSVVLAFLFLAVTVNLSVAF